MTESLDTLTPTSDERMMGALAHFFGLIGALIIWAIQKDKSRFVRFQAAQALAFDFVTMLLTLVVFFCSFGAMFIGIFGTIFAAANSSASSETVSPFMMFPFMFPWLMFACIFPFSIALFVARIVAAISVLNGNNFRYPWLGAKVENFLSS
jgi:uncharacterized Tic20 family protein